MRVSTSGQDDLLQRRALIDAGVEERDIFADVTSGARAAADRPGMARLLEYAVAGDTIVVWRIDQLRSRSWTSLPASFGCARRSRTDSGAP